MHKYAITICKVILSSQEMKHGHIHTVQSSRYPSIKPSCYILHSLFSIPSHKKNFKHQLGKAQLKEKLPYWPSGQSSVPPPSLPTWPTLNRFILFSLPFYYKITYNRFYTKVISYHYNLFIL